MKTNSMADAKTAGFGLVQAGIVLTTLITAIVHLVILNLNGIDLMFTLNGLGYLALLAALFLPASFLRENRGLVYWAFIAFTILSILAWVVLGDKSWPGGALGYLTKLDEIVLVILLWLDKPR